MKKPTCKLILMTTYFQKRLRITLTDATLCRGFIRGNDKDGVEQGFWFDDIITLNGFVAVNKK